MGFLQAALLSGTAPELKSFSTVDCLRGFTEHRSRRNDAAEFIFDVDGYDLVKAGLGTEAQTFSAARIKAAGPSLDETDDIRVEFMTDSGNGPLAGNAPKRIDLLTHSHRHARHRQVAPRTDLGCIDGRRMHKEIDGGPRRGMGMTNIHRDRQDRLLTVQRFADDAREKARSRLIGLPRPYANGGQPDPYAIEKSAPRVIGQKQLTHRLLRAIARKRRQKEFIPDRLRERSAENGDGGREDKSWLVSIPDGADGIEQKPGTVEIDPVALVEIGLGLAGNDGGKVEDDIGTTCNELLRLSRNGEIG